MAEPLRKAAGYGGSTLAARPLRRDPVIPPPQRTRQDTGAPPRRLVSRQIRSNAENRRALALLFTAMSVVMFLMLISNTFIKADVSRLNYNINKIQRENDQLIISNARTEGQIAASRSLERIEERARIDLGMVKNEKIDYMVLSDTITTDGKIKAPTPDESEDPVYEKTIEAAFGMLLDLISK